MTNSSAAVRGQIESILLAWGMEGAAASRTADVLAWADLHGIDSHGISMLTMYNDWRRKGRLNLHAQPKLITESPVTGVIDADGGLGHSPSYMAMEIAMRKAKESGLAAVTVRNSAHFGAVGYYTNLATQNGLISLATTSASGVIVAPTGGAQPRFGTDPISFAAPSADGRPFLLDMATTSVAFGKVRNKANEGASMPPGWGLTNKGEPTTDPRDVVERQGMLTSLGGAPESGSYKGYGLAAMVGILSSCLSGATLASDPMHTRKPQGLDIGHFFLVMNPAFFREEQAFEADVQTLCDNLRATPPLDPAKPVMVAGDPERIMAEKRSKTGITLAPGLRAKLVAIAQEAGAPWTLN